MAGQYGKTGVVALFSQFQTHALRDAEPLGDIALEQLKIEPPLPDVIA